MSAYLSIDVSSQQVGGECARSAEMLAEIFNDLEYRRSVGDFTASGRWLKDFLEALEPDAVEMLSGLAKAAEGDGATEDA